MNRRPYRIKRNKLLSARNNYFDYGGVANSISNPLSTGNTGIGQTAKIPDTVNGPVSNANTSGGGSSALGMVGGIASLASQGVSDITNMINNITGSGVKAKADAMINDVMSQQMDAQADNDSFDNLLSDWSDNSTIGHVTASDLGKKGFGEAASGALAASASGAAAGSSLGPWGALGGAGSSLITNVIGSIFGNKQAEKQAERVNEYVDYVNKQRLAQLNNRAENLKKQQFSGLNANYAALGGLLFSRGGNIHIAPNKKGTFTAAATKHGMGVQEFAEEVLTNKEDYSPAMRKKANFARNASKWHAFGGDLMTHGANFDTGITLVGNGNTHEQNPYEGVQMGVDEEGTPNLVEEGEVIFNDYVFSKRLKVPKKFRNKYKLGGNISFADAALKLSKESEERPNDPISRAGLEDSMMKLMIVQEQLRTKKEHTNSFARGGKMGKVYAGDQDDPYSQMLDLGLGPVAPTWDLMAPQPEAPAPPKNEMGIVLGGYTSNPTIIRPGESTIPEIINTQRTSYPSPAVTTKSSNISTSTKTGDDIALAPTWMRYIPAFASGIMSFTDAIGLTNKPDYSDADAVLQATKKAGKYQPVKFDTISNYVKYTPFDTEYAANQANAVTSASRRALLNTAGNRAQAMAGILSLDNNALNQLGMLRRGAAEDNYRRMLQAEEFNRGTNMFNSEGKLKADVANQEALSRSQSVLLNGTLAAAQLKQAERQQAAAARSANLSNFINSLGDIGRENMAWNWRNFGLETGSFGNIGESERLLTHTKKKAKGGKMKRRKGLTI